MAYFNNDDVIRKIYDLTIVNSKETVPINDKMRLKLKLKAENLVDIRLIYDDKVIKTGECAQDDTESTINILLNDFKDVLQDIIPDNSKDDENVLTQEEFDEAMIDMDYMIDNATRTLISVLKEKHTEPQEIKNEMIDYGFDVMQMSLIGYDIDELITEVLQDDI